MTFSPRARSLLRWRPVPAVVLAVALACGGPVVVRADGPPAPMPPASPGAPAVAPDATSLAQLDAVLTPDQRGLAHWLEHMGWRYVRDPAVQFVTLEGGTPGQKPGLAAAQQAGDLRMRVPATVTPAVGAGFAAQLDRIADWEPTRVAWQFLMKEPVLRATARLSALADKGTLAFPRLLFFQSPTYKIECPKPEWRQEGRLCIAQGSGARALEALYTRGGMIECYTGQVLEMFTAQYELYGPAWFDQVFQAEEIAIGGSFDARNGKLGDFLKEDLEHPVRALFLEGDAQSLDPGLALAKVGPIAFTGMTGALMNLVQNAGANQNLVFVSVSPEANRLLLENGGFAYCDALLQEALGEQRSALRPTTTGGGDSWARKDALLASPALTGIQVYVHPHGVLSLTDLAKREMVHVGGKLHLRMYTQGFEWFLFRRYRRAWKDRWLVEHGFPPSPPRPVTSASGGSVPGTSVPGAPGAPGPR